MEIMASTSNAEISVKIATIAYQLCDYKDFRADFLKTRICGKWSVFANQVTYVIADIKALCLQAFCALRHCILNLIHSHFILRTNKGCYCQTHS